MNQDSPANPAESDEEREALIHADVFNPAESDFEYFQRRARALGVIPPAAAPCLPLPPEQLESLPTKPPSGGGKFRVAITGTLQPPSWQVWEHLMVEGDMLSFYRSTYPMKSFAEHTDVPTA